MNGGSGSGYPERGERVQFDLMPTVKCGEHTRETPVISVAESSHFFPSKTGRPHKKLRDCGGRHSACVEILVATAERPSETDRIAEKLRDLVEALKKLVAEGEQGPPPEPRPEACEKTKAWKGLTQRLGLRSASGGGRQWRPSSPATRICPARADRAAEKAPPVRMVRRTLGPRARSSPVCEDQEFQSIGLRRQSVTGPFGAPGGRERRPPRWESLVDATFQ
jgi:hypothetical protein